MAGDGLLRISCLVERRPLAGSIATTAGLKVFATAAADGSLTS